VRHDAVDDLNAWVKKVVDELPPLTDAQRDVLALIFRSKPRIEGPARGEPTASIGCTSVPDVLPLVAVRGRE
jgi:hypothetical protein